LSGTNYYRLPRSGSDLTSRWMRWLRLRTTADEKRARVGSAYRGDGYGIEVRENRTGRIFFFICHSKRDIPRRVSQEVGETSVGRELKTAVNVESNLMEFESYQTHKTLLYLAEENRSNHFKHV